MADGPETPPNYEVQFAHRFSLQDQEYQQYVSRPANPPPVVDDWRGGGHNRGGRFQDRGGPRGRGWGEERGRDRRWGRDRDRDRSGGRDRDGYRDRSGGRDGDRDRSGGRDRDGDRDRSGGRDRDGDRDRSGGRDRDGDRDRSGGRDGDRDRSGGRDRDGPQQWPDRGYGQGRGGHRSGGNSYNQRPSHDDRY
ncbi:hypothetical protein DPEC_G00250950 [Dallia pectoralis]|uniref:Uncharacterized protein n=1 Tax=Dallia pectoralis TaxID=75939 RepID=A0ACC2FTC5_DALPE|nr:hypothetical protein DPEC_G00250950 [Dallia pectoralis]